MGFDDGMGILGPIIHVLPPLVDLIDPIAVLPGLNQGQQLLQHLFDVTHHAVVGGDVFVDLRRVDVDVDDIGAFLHIALHRRAAVRKARAQHDQRVGVDHRLRAGGAPVHADHAQVELFLISQNAVPIMVWQAGMLALAMSACSSLDAPEVTTPPPK